MRICEACHCHVHVDEGACPFCGQALQQCKAPRVSRWALSVGLGLAACGGGGDDGGESEVEASSSSSSTGTGTSGEASTSTSDESSETATSEGESTVSSGGFYAGWGGEDIPSSDGIECDPFVDDGNCVEGEKCAPLPPGVDGPSPDSEGICVDLLGNAGLGEPCTDMIGSPQDTCDPGLLCWVEGDAEDGRCIAYCDPSEVGMSCGGADESCSASMWGTVSPCLPDAP